jgi:hypothetical protein
LQLLAWKPCVKNSLRGFASVELPIGLKIHDIPVLVGPKGPRANLPAKPQIDQDRRQKTDVNGKPAYTAMPEWRPRDLANRFFDAVIGLIRAAHPDALEG